jgi:5'-deoxynucleotidase YfbR-like HD superfamily hydrolase
MIELSEGSELKVTHLLDFIWKVGCLKKIRRTGWVEVGIDKPESVADHSYRCAILAMLFGDLKRLDTERIIRMALLHDLHESVTGDLTPRQKSNQSNHVIIEMEAAESIFSDLPEVLRKKYAEIFEEYQSQLSPEAKLLKEVDKLEMGLQAMEYHRNGHDFSVLSRFVETASSYIQDADLREILKTAGSDGNIMKDDRSS